MIVGAVDIESEGIIILKLCMIWNWKKRLNVTRMPISVINTGETAVGVISDERIDYSYERRAVL